MQTIDQALEKLNKSDFRSKFHLDEKDKAYVRAKGMDEIRRMQRRSWPNAWRLP